MAIPLALALPLVGCGGGDVADAVGPGKIEVEMAEQNDSNVAGVRAVLTYVAKNRTRVLVDGAGPGEPSTGGRLTAHLRTGSCADPGKAVGTLAPLRRGRVTGTVPLGLPALIDEDHAVDVTGPPSVGVIACGDLPDTLPK